MKKIWVNRAKPPGKAETFDADYYLAMSGTDRLKIVQFLREMHRRIKKGLDGEGRKGLRIVIKVIQ